MKKQDQYDWVDFYGEFALKLLDYKDKRNELIEKVREIYTMSGMEMPTLERDNRLVDIDPFTVFGLFNKKLTDENRIKILTAIAALFEVKRAVPTSFDSLPVLNPQNATFYYFVDQRGRRTSMICGPCMNLPWPMHKPRRQRIGRPCPIISIW